MAYGSSHDTDRLMGRDPEPLDAYVPDQQVCPAGRTGAGLSNLALVYPLITYLPERVDHRPVILTVGCMATNRPGRIGSLLGDDTTQS